MATPLGRYLVDSWGTEDELPQSSVNDVLQTRDGYLWLATFGGLARFDGLRFEVFEKLDGHGEAPASASLW